VSEMAHLFRSESCEMPVEQGTSSQIDYSQLPSNDDSTVLLKSSSLHSLISVDQREDARVNAVRCSNSSVCSLNNPHALTTDFCLRDTPIEFKRNTISNANESRRFHDQQLFSVVLQISQKMDEMSNKVDSKLTSIKDKIELQRGDIDRMAGVLGNLEHRTSEVYHKLLTVEGRVEKLEVDKQRCVEMQSKTTRKVLALEEGQETLDERLSDFDKKIMKLGGRLEESVNVMENRIKEVKRDLSHFQMIAEKPAMKLQKDFLKSEILECKTDRVFCASVFNVSPPNNGSLKLNDSDWVRHNVQGVSDDNSEGPEIVDVDFRSVKVELPEYDGTTDPEAFVDLVRRAANYNHWDQEAIYFSLLKSLKGKAKCILDMFVPGTHLNANIILEGLKERFSQRLQQDEALNKLNGLHQMKGEDLASLSARVRHIVNHAYPAADQGTREMISHREFINAIHDERVRQQVLLQCPIDMNGALRIAERVANVLKSNSSFDSRRLIMSQTALEERRGDNRRDVSIELTKQKRFASSVAGGNTQQKFQGNVSAGDVESQNRSPGDCYSCQRPGHFARNCPSQRGEGSASFSQGKESTPRR
jgi:hypothetical protein